MHDAPMRQFWVYILANESRLMYVGVTNDLVRRLEEHRTGLGSFTARYRIRKLVHYEVTTDAMVAITREKQLKGWLRKKKKTLVELANPEWRDLSEDWVIPPAPDSSRSLPGAGPYPSRSLP
jgi:putative endonuclease